MEITLKDLVNFDRYIKENGGKFNLENFYEYLKEEYIKEKLRVE